MKRLVLAITTLLLASCGTDTGNPGFGSPNGTVGGSSVFMVPAMCTKLSACYPSLTYGNCYAGVFATTGMTAAMNINATTYPTLNSAASGVLNGALRVNQTALDQCSNAIHSLTCADTLVTSSYATGTPANFTNAYHILSASSACQSAVSP